MGILKLNEMKNIFKYITIAFAACALLAGCQKDESTVDPYSVNWVYLEQPAVNSFRVAFKPDGLWEKAFNESDVLKRVRCTKPASKDVTVSLAIEEAYVEEYNQKNGTDYKLLTVAQLENETFVIKAGNYTSEDSIKVTYNNPEALISEGSARYMLPIIIKSVDSSMAISEQGVVNLFYEAEEQAGQIKVNPSGTELSREAWTIKTSDGIDYTSKLGAANASSVDFTSGSELVVDFGEAVQFKCLGIKYQSEYYSVKNLTVLVSEDGIDFKSVGTYETPKRESHNIELSKSRNVKAVKIRLNAGYYSSYMTLKEIYATTDAN